MNDDIVAIATAHGISSISIIILSGKNALFIATKMVNNVKLKPRYATLCNLYNSKKEILDEAIVIYFKSPYSFTGEDVVEFQTHGGFVVSNMIMEEIITYGVRYAEPGEFSKRAFLNGKMDLIKAEAIQSLIEARSENAAKILARTMQGELLDYVNSLRDEIIKTLSFVEVCIDYAEEDLPEDVLDNARVLLCENNKKLENIIKISEQRKGLIDGFKVAIIGKPNVGKSSLLNSLLKYERAIISDEEGTTRDRIEENIKVGTHLIKIIDTAGIRKNAGKIESIGIEYSLKAIQEADIILAMFDKSNIADEQDKKILELCNNSNKKIFYILNKIDLEPKFTENLEEPIEISASKDSNKILDILKNYLDSQNYDGLMLSSNRQILACINANEAMKKAILLLNENELELFAFELNQTIKFISSISKPYERDEVLDSMFSNFCLGK